MKFFTLFLLGFLTISKLHTQAQSFPPDLNNYKYKLGLKLIVDRSNDMKLTPYRTTVYSAGIPFSYRVAQSSSTIESGLYMITKAIGISENESVLLYNISVPVNYRYDHKFVYASAGAYFDYLLDTENYDETYFSHGTYSYYLRNFNVGINLQLGLEAHFIKQYYVFIETRISHNLTSTFLSDNGSGYVGMSSYGLAAGVNYKLIKWKK